MGPEHSKLATTLDNLATLYVQQGKCIEAEQLYLRALRIKERVMGMEHLKVATTLDRLAMLYMRQGEFVGAERLRQRALAIREKARRGI